MAFNIRELSMMDATAQAELVRQQELTPLELVECSYRSHRTREPGTQRGDHTIVRGGARGCGLT